MTDRKPLKILRVAGSTYPEVVGGIGLHVHHMSRVQAEMGHEVTVLTSDNGNTNLPRREERSGYELIRHRELTRPFDNTFAPGVLNTIRDSLNEYDILHAHSHLFFLTNMAAGYGTFTDLPVVVTNHSVYSQTAPFWVQRIFNNTIGRLTFDAADRILCYTETDRDRLRELGISSPVRIIHNGIDCDTFEPDNTSRDDQLIIVARLKDGKGVDHAIKAFARVADKYPKHRLKIVGDGPLRGELQSLADDLGVRDRIDFVGEIPNEKVADEYRNSALFLLPSDNEGLPRSVLEAMACETPVVTSDLPQLRDVVEGAGRQTSQDVDQLAGALQELLESEDLRRRMGERGRKTVLEEFSWRDTVSQTNQVYYDLLDEGYRNSLPLLRNSSLSSFVGWEK